MTDRPIIFSAPMIRALLEGRKTQTRRVLKEQRHVAKPVRVIRHPVDAPSYHAFEWRSFRDTYLSEVSVPYAPGERLWVREAWKPGSWRDDGRVAVDYRASPELTKTPWIDLPYDAGWEDLWARWTDELRAAGSEPDDDGIHHWEPGQSPLRWRSPIHMPRWASRLTLIVTDVRVQRLHEIGDSDAIAEGATSRPNCYFSGLQDGWSMDWSRVGTLSRWASVPPGCPKMNPLKASDICLGDPQMAFANYWNSLHGDGAWEANPWVAAISFDIHWRNIDAIDRWLSGGDRSPKEEAAEWADLDLARLRKERNR